MKLTNWRNQTCIFILVAAAFASAGCDESPAPPAIVALEHPARSPARETMQRDRIAAGDWLRVKMPDLNGIKDPAVLNIHVSAEGDAVFPLVGGLKVAGKTPAQVQDVLICDYSKHNEADPVDVKVVWLCQTPQEDPLPCPIAVGDLVRVEVNFSPDPAVISRVAADGSFTLPRLGRVRVEGLTEGLAAHAIATKYTETGMAGTWVTVLTLEPAAPGADLSTLPNGPVYFVPEPLKPLLKP
jgi:protein involved in polysaccharide export with SLBB domain